MQTAFQEVSDALIAREKFAEFQVAQQTQVDAQRKADTIALARYRVGYSSYFNVIDADRDLFNAELSLSAAHLNTLCRHGAAVPRPRRGMAVAAGRRARPDAVAVVFFSLRPTPGCGARVS